GRRNGPKVGALSLAGPQESTKPRVGASCKTPHNYGCGVMQLNLRCRRPAVRIQHHVGTVSDGENECDMKDPSPVSSPKLSDQLSDQPAEAPLDSWKEIAGYVKRDVSTVQRWERREGMPIHRHVHDKRGSVYAFSSELDAWLQSRRLRLEE